MRSRLSSAAWCVTALVCAAGGGLAGAQPASAPGAPHSVAPTNLPALRVVVTLPPLKSLVEPLLPPGSTVDVLIPPGVSEHGYEIAPSKLRALGEADVVVRIGAGMEPQVDKALMQRASERRRVVTFAEIAGVQGEHDCEDHDHEGHDHHHHEHDLAADPHVWLSPPLVEALVDALAKDIAASLTARAAGAPDAAAFVQARADALRQRVRDVDAQYRARLAKAQRRTIITAHNAFSHLAARYDLKVVTLTGINAGEPTISALREAARVVKEQGLTTIFVEPQLSPAAARRLAEETGAKVAVLDPLGTGDWFALMESNLRALGDALGAPDDGAPQPKPGAKAGAP